MFNRSTTKFNLLVFIAIFSIYLFLGAQLFSSIERPTEQMIINQMMQTRKDFLEKYSCVQGADRAVNDLPSISICSFRTGF